MPPPPVQTSYADKGAEVRPPPSRRREGLRREARQRVTPPRAFSPAPPRACALPLAPQPDYGSMYGFDHIQYWVGNAKQAGACLEGRR